MSVVVSKNGREYVVSGRNEKRSHTPHYAICSKCGDSMYRIAVNTTKDGKKLHITLPIKFCLRCKILRFLLTGKEVSI